MQSNISTPTSNLPRRSALAMILTALSGTLAGCSTLGVINALTPKDSYQKSEALSYGPEPRHMLDLYMPVHKREKTPLVVFFYGGSWTSGARQDYLFVGEALASKGIAVAVADYGLSPAVRYPAFLHDSALAVHWALHQAKALGCDGVYVMGHSAGAYNAAMMALDPRWLKPHGDTPQQLAGWIGLAGPYDFLPIGIPEVQIAFGWPNTPVDSQPVFQAQSRQSVPALLVASRNDDVVSTPRNSVVLAKALDRQGVKVRLALMDRMSHAGVIGAFSAPVRPFTTVLEQVAGFIFEPNKTTHLDT